MIALLSFNNWATGPAAVAHLNLASARAEELLCLLQRGVAIPQGESQTLQVGRLPCKQLVAAFQLLQVPSTCCVALVVTTCSCSVLLLQQQSANILMQHTQFCTGECQPARWIWWLVPSQCTQ